MNSNRNLSRLGTRHVAVLLIIASLLPIPALGDSNSIEELVEKGWEQLHENLPIEAGTTFEQAADSKKTSTRAAALRGLGAVERFLSSTVADAEKIFRSFSLDRDTVMLEAAWMDVLSFGRSGAGRRMKTGYKVLQNLTEGPRINHAERHTLYASRLLNDGRPEKARSIIDDLGLIRSYMMIGPFENISGSGYEKSYPPEKDIRVDTSYTGKNNNTVEWHPLQNEVHNGWVFAQNSYADRNAVIYYHANIRSPDERPATLRFGASASFKVYLNGSPVLADSVFRNTGADTYMQTVVLLKGDNKLLIKLCFESTPGNFLIRFTDTTGRKMEDLVYSNRVGKYKKNPATFDDIANTPNLDALVAELRARIKKNPDNLEYPVALMGVYNGWELTDEAQSLAREYLKKWPESALWHGLYAEALRRGRKLTDAATALRTAYRLCPLHAEAWEYELGILLSSAGERRAMQFLNESPKHHKNSSTGLSTRFRLAAKSNDETAALDALKELEERHRSSPDVVLMLATFYGNQGEAKKAERLLKDYLKSAHSSTTFYNRLSALYLKMGKIDKAFDTYTECLVYNPVAPGIYGYLARLSLQRRNHSGARTYIEKALATAPASSELLNLKGAILSAREEYDSAMEVYEKNLKYNHADFTAWDRLFQLRGEPQPTSLAPLPSLDSLTTYAQYWDKMDGDLGTILSHIKDVFLYPSNCSRERNFLAIHLPTQGAIDAWKEYSIPYNGYYQVLNVNRAFSRRTTGEETPADVEGNMVVFKTLAPGDLIVLEYMLENHYTGEMAGHVWGEHSFDLPFPVFQTKLRLVTPASDTIPYTQYGDSIRVETETEENYRITTFERPRYANPPMEPFTLQSPPHANRVGYSTIPNWKYVSRWYKNLTRGKLEQTPEIREIADSLLAGATSDAEKAHRIHSYITSTIRYSYLPFRQSAWIPQAGSEVLASRIGDCKDMSSLAKAFFDYAGIQSNLVLVNTRDQNPIYPSYVGPDFNHCIVSYAVDDRTQYVDPTNPYLPSHELPKMDQGSLALVIGGDRDSLIHLPLDLPEERKTDRRIEIVLDSAGTMKRSAETIRTGIQAGYMRGAYRFSAPSERLKLLQQQLVSYYPNIELDSVDFGNLDTLSDSIAYFYSYASPGAVTFSGTAGVFALNIPDAIRGDAFPNNSNRTYDIDMNQAWFDIGSYSTEMTVNFPANWRPVTLPEPVSITTENGRYELTVHREGNSIHLTRYASFNFRTPLPAKENKPLRAFLSEIARADNIQLMFFTSGGTH